MADRNDSVVLGANEEAVRKKGHNILPKMISVILAFILWFYVMTVESPVNHEVFRGIPVEVLAEKNGIDILTYAKAISYGGGQNFYLDSKKDVIAEDNFTTAFSVANMHKDVHICLDLAKQCGVSMPGEENAASVYDAAMEQGFGGEDFSATVKVVRGKSC